MFRDLLLGIAGEGDAARNIRRSAASSLRGLLNVLFLGLGEGVRGIRGGDERIWRALTWKDCKGRSESSSSDGKERSSARLSWEMERSRGLATRGPLVYRRKAGELSARRCDLFQVCDRVGGSWILAVSLSTLAD